VKQSERVGKIFDDWAAAGKAEGMEERHTPTARRAFEQLAIVPGQAYLDIGCGNGYSVRWAADVDPSIRAVGLDVSPRMIERAKVASANVPNASFLLGAFPSDQLDEGSFDAIFSMEVFYYLEDIDAGFAAARRLLRPSGRFACAVDRYVENKDSHSWADDLGVPMHLLSMAEWKDRFAQAGFTQVDQELAHPTLITYGTLRKLKTVA
jgi:ubiquinone/menaquinone biosynthesis C-methylase UbiE